jgi:hypothetical protein
MLIISLLPTERSQQIGHILCVCLSSFHMDTIRYLIKLFSNEVFTAFSNLSAIISALISIYLFFTIRRLKNNYLFKIRVPQLIDELKMNASNLVNYTNDFANSIAEIKLEIGKIEVKLGVLKGKVPRNTKRSIERVVMSINSYKADDRKEGRLYDTYVEMQKLIEEINNLYEDRKLEE